METTIASTDAYPSDPISPRDAARLLGVHISAVYRWMDRGRLPFWELPSGHKRLSRAVVLSLPRLGTARKPVTFRAEDRQAVEAMRAGTRATLRRFGLV